MNEVTRSTTDTDHGRSPTMWKITPILCFLIAIGVSGVYGQSIDVRDGSNAVGVSGYIDLDSDITVRSIGGRSAYSIAGIMDIGISMSNNIEEIEDTVGTVQTLSLVYSIIPVKQQSGVLPVSVQMGIDYGLSFVDPELVRAELERDIDRFGGDLEDIDVRRYDGSRTGYTLSALVSGDIPLTELFEIRLGVGGEYRVERTNYTAFLTTGTEDDSDGIELIGDRIQRTYFGPGVGLVYRSPQGFVASWNNKLLFDESFGFQYRPEISLAIFQR